MCQSGASDQPMIRLLCWHGAARAVHLPAFYGDMQTAAAVFAANPALAEDPEALANAAGNGHDGFVRLMAGRPGGRSRAREPAPPSPSDPSYLSQVLPSCRQPIGMSACYQR